eukprot:scaffold32557_cov99-Isochrysis_galbana.AAC.5
MPPAPLRTPPYAARAHRPPQRGPRASTCRLRRGPGRESGAAQRRERAARRRCRRRGGPTRAPRAENCQTRRRGRATCRTEGCAATRAPLAAGARRGTCRSHSTPQPRC